MIIRQARPEDAAALFEMHQRSVNAFCASEYSAEHMSEWFVGRSSEMYQSALHASRLWLAEASGQLVGFVEVEPGEVTLLFVAPEASGQAIGSRLLEFGIQQAVGASQEAVSVIATMNSVSFYQRHGFQQVEEQFFVRGDPPRKYPVVKMVRDPQAPRLEPLTDA